MFSQDQICKILQNNVKFAKIWKRWAGRALLNLSMLVIFLTISQRLLNLIEKCSKYTL